MSPWAVFAQAVVYPIARAWADAYFDALRQSATYIEETPNETDADRAARFRAAVERVRQRTYDTGPDYTPSSERTHKGVDSSTTLRRKNGGDGNGSPQGVVGS